jgi:hypothetical protein
MMGCISEDSHGLQGQSLKTFKDFEDRTVAVRK